MIQYKRLIQFLIIVSTTIENKYSEMSRNCHSAAIYPNSDRHAEFLPTDHIWHVGVFVTAYVIIRALSARRRHTILLFDIELKNSFCRRSASIRLQNITLS